MNAECYMLTMVRGGSIDIYSVRVDSDSPTVLLFKDRDDAERYVIMLEEDDSYTVGETCVMDITEVPLSDAVNALENKGHRYILIGSDELFIPPDSTLF